MSAEKKTEEPSQLAQDICEGLSLFFEKVLPAVKAATEQIAEVQQAARAEGYVWPPRVPVESKLTSITSDAGNARFTMPGPGRYLIKAFGGGRGRNLYQLLVNDRLFAIVGGSEDLEAQCSLEGACDVVGEDTVVVRVGVESGSINNIPVYLFVEHVKE